MMKPERRTLALLACLTAAVVAFTSCSAKSKGGAEYSTAQPGETKAQPATSAPTPGEAQPPAATPATPAAAQPAEPGAQAARAAAIQLGQPGGLVVDTYQLSATVTDIDKDKRKVTLQAADGAKTVVKAGPEVVNFDQIAVGDTVKAQVTEQLVVFVRKSTEPAGPAQAATVTLAPVGVKPGAFMAETTEATAKVAALDPQKHEATLQFSDGKSKTFKVRPDIDLSKYSTDDEVVIRSTEALAILVEKP